MHIKVEVYFCHRMFISNMSNPNNFQAIMKKTLTLLSAFLATQPIFSRVICDTTCHAPDDGISNYAVVSPIGRSIVQHVTQAPRLTTLDNKTIAVVGVSFMAHITHPEIKRLLETHYKNVTVLLTDEMGYAGPYPGMGIDRPQAEAFKQKLIEHHVITGDTARNKVQVMPGGGYSTVKVQVPSD